MSHDKQLTILGHLIELRNRLIKSVIAIAITTTVAFVFADQIFAVLIKPAGGFNLIYIEMTEMVSTYMKVCLAAGIVAAMPYLIIHLVMFVAPALTPKEKKYVLLILPWIGLMFTGGVVFGYFVLLPPAMKFLFTFGGEIATAQIKIGNYISVVIRLLLAIGLVFELPVLTTFLAKLGIVTSSWLAGKRKIALVLALVLAALITPTVDPINMLLVAVPLIVLYEMGIWLAKIVEPRKRPIEYSVLPEAPRD